jgi:Rod binding domain-containing protein
MITSLHSGGTPGLALQTASGPASEPEPSPGSRMQKLTKVAQQFEGVLLSSLLQEVQKGMVDSSAGGLGAGSDTLQSLGTQAVAQALAQKGGLGIAKMIVRHFHYLADDGS